MNDQTDGGSTAYPDVTETAVRTAFDEADYVAEDEIITTVLLALRLGKPLLVEGEPGAGKTELAKVLAGGFGSDLIRLQCYEGLAAEHALYEWNYTKQLLSAQTENGPAESVFTEDYLLERPLLSALKRGDDTPPVLLVDEIDRADEGFEALLLEVLSDFQVSVPELGTVEAERPPIVLITSNRTRTLSDALKRRCLYLHVSPPSFEKETAILRRKVPTIDDILAAELCAVTARLREEPLRKPPGAAETIDWARAVDALRNGSEEPNDGCLSSELIRNTIGCLLKEVEDVERVDDELLTELLETAERASAES